MREVFEGAGTLREAYRRVDWAATPLGPVSSWTPTLRASVDLAFRTRFPVTLFWGPRLVTVYNEAYVPLIGDKHPAALGAPAAEVFPEIWETIGPMLDAVLSGQSATFSEDLRLLMDRHGFTEECFFTFSYSAVRSLDGRIEGVIDISAETTAQVVSRRRLALLASLTDALADLDDAERIPPEAVRVLRENPHDLPEVELLLPGSDREPPSFRQRDLVVEATGDRPTLWLRLSAAGPVIAARLSTHLAVDEQYLRFVRVLGATVTHAYGRARARETERRLADLERNMSETLQRSLLTPPAQPEHLRVAVRYQPAAEQVSIGGDWYDSFLLPDGGLALVIGDVVGHDRHAAAAMAQVRNLLRGVATTLREPPAAVLTGLDATMHSLAVSTFVTAVLARMAPDGQGGELTMRWSNAGHPPPVLISPDGRASVLYTRPDLMLGVHFGAARHDHTTAVPPGASVVLYTDGLIGRGGQTIDEWLIHLLDTLSGCQHLSPDELCDRLLAQYGEAADDDIALIVLSVPPAP